MLKSGYLAMQIILKLSEVEALLTQGQSVQQALRTLKISERTYDSWRREYWGTAMILINELEESKKENTRLRAKINALSLHDTALRELRSSWPYRIGENLRSIRTSTGNMAETFGIERARENIASDVMLYGIRDDDAAEALRELMTAAAEDELAKYALEVEDDN